MVECFPHVLHMVRNLAGVLFGLRPRGTRAVNTKRLNSPIPASPSVALVNKPETIEDALDVEYF